MNSSGGGKGRFESPAPNPPFTTSTFCVGSPGVNRVEGGRWRGRARGGSGGGRRDEQRQGSEWSTGWVGLVLGGVGWIARRMGFFALGMWGFGKGQKGAGCIWPPAEVMGQRDCKGAEPRVIYVRGIARRALVQCTDYRGCKKREIWWGYDEKGGVGKRPTARNHQGEGQRENSYRRLSSVGPYCCCCCWAGLTGTVHPDCGGGSRQPLPTTESRLLHYLWDNQSKDS